MQSRKFVFPLTSAFSTLYPKQTLHHGTRTQRAVRAITLSILGLVVVAQPALAATPRHTMQRFLERGEKVSPSGTVTATAGAQYGLFNCQVIGTLLRRIALTPTRCATPIKSIP